MKLRRLRLLLCPFHKAGDRAWLATVAGVLVILASCFPALAATAPAITTQPASATIFYGDPVTFSVGATGTKPLSYQWFRNGAPISLATTSAYTISATSSNDNGAGFCVQVANSAGATTSAVAVLTVDFGILLLTQTNHLLSYDSVWKYNQTENLDGANWTAADYDDSGWPAGPGLLAFENNSAITPLIGTTLDDPRSPPAGLKSGHAYYFRVKVVAPSDAADAMLVGTYRCDDGAMIYINTNVAQRIRMPDDPIWNMTMALGFPPDPTGRSDATADESFSMQGGLVPGTNVIAVSVHQANNTSSDVVWGLAVDAITPGARQRDTTAPAMAEIFPAPGSQVPSLTQVEVHFTEGVKYVRAGDLLINNVPATNVTAYAPNNYVFDFPQPPTGQVQVAWSPAQAIVDLSANSNRFDSPGLAWTYTLNPMAIASQVLITEFMAGNTQTIRDEDGHYSDWIELYNTSDQPISLAHWHLTDSLDNLDRWQFPAGVSILGKSFLLVWASGNDRTNPAAPLHTNFKLDKKPGSFLGLVYSDSATIVSSFTSYPQQYDDVSYGRDRLDPTLTGYFTNATPGAANASIGPGFGPEVQFSVASGTFRQPFTLQLSTADPNAVIRYLLVTNGTTARVTNVPTLNSPLYTGPLTINSTVQVRARAFAPQTNYLPGPVHNETYFLIAANVATLTSDLPMVVIHNMGAGTDVPATDNQFIALQVFDTRNGRSSMLNPPDLAVQGYFHRRGQATFGNAKANMRVETQNEYGDDLNVELVGMPAENDWVFYGINGFDKVLMHNPLAHELYREMGHYSSHTRYVEVFIKLGTGAAGPVSYSDYYGLYVLEEKIKIDKNRVDIDKLQPENTNAPSLTGGYLLSIDKSNPGSPVTLANASMWYLDPDYYAITSPQRAAQRQYINNYFSSFYSALMGANWTNPLTGYAAYIDLDSWIDYHLHDTFVFNADMLRISSYFYKPRNGKLVQGPLWDFDRAFADSNDDRGFNPRLWRSLSSDGGTDPFNPGNTFNNPWYSRLFTDPDFWQRWIDRYQELRKTVYHITNLNARIDYFGNQVRAATVREYGRWGDTQPRSGYYYGDGFGYTFPSPGTWQGEINFTKCWFSNRVDFMDTNFLNPPVFSSNGGAITSGFPLVITASTREANSRIYYTLNGTDPRLPGGGISPAAFTSVNTANLTLSTNARVFARNYNSAHRNLTGANNPPISSPWSGPTAATFIIATPALAVTEIMYNPLKPASGTNDNEDFEFIELKNVGTQPLSLPGIRFTNGIDFTFSSTNAMTSLGPSQYLVLVRNRGAFLSRYPGVTNIAGQYTGKLDNAGQRLYLEGPFKEPILDFHYDNSWYPVTDGRGFSLVIRNENAPFSSWTNPVSWRASTAIGGSPGQADPAPATIPAILITEALTHTDPPQVDTVELFNPTADPAPLGGWFLSDDPAHPAKYIIPTNIVLAPGEYALISEDQFGNNGPNSFRLSSLGDEIYLFSGDVTNLTGYRHGFKFGPQVNGVTLGRYVTSDGLEHFVTQTRNTLGQPNAGPKIGPIVINEIMYSPVPFGLDPDNVDEYVELRNITRQPAPLFDPVYPTNCWRLDGAVQFTFPPDLTLAAMSYLLVVSFDPAHDPASLAWFRGRYNLDTNTPVFGPFQGHLGNQGERLALLLPDKPELPDSPTPGFVPYVTAEEVHYSGQPPWPAGTDGTGKSLQRLAGGAFADDPVNWVAGAPTPGNLNAGSAAVDTDGDGLPDEWELANGFDPNDAGGINGALGDVDGDGMNNYQEYIAGTDPLDAQDFLQVNQISISGQSCLLTFNTRLGRTYTVEVLTRLGSTDTWSTLTNNIAGTGGPITVSDPLTQAARFYRLKVSF